MNILSHRGLWRSPEERNTLRAFRHSFELGFGTETDLRDQNGRIVISHDPPTRQCLPLEDFLELHASMNPTLPLALNVKADGLQQDVGRLLQQYEIESYFFFDMSTPDMLGYQKKSLRVFTRLSEHEQHPVLLELSQGIWLDSFESNWFDKEVISSYVSKGHSLCVVSPEIHGRDPGPLWSNLREWFDASAGLSLCTDRPVEAQAFFETSR